VQTIWGAVLKLVDLQQGSSLLLTAAVIPDLFLNEWICIQWTQELLDLGSEA
jgi:hypothetical protein